jgi:MoxR-like ATPase
MAETLEKRLQSFIEENNFGLTPSVPTGKPQFGEKITFEDLDVDVQAKLQQTGVTHKVVLAQLPNLLKQADLGTIPANTHPEFIMMLDDLTNGNNIFLVGKKGTGKSHLSRELAKSLRRDSVKINCNQWTSPSELIGGQTIEGYREGALIDAWKNGKALILDELPKLDPNTAGVLNDALALTQVDVEDSVIFSAEVDDKGAKKGYKRHKDFCCIASGNTTGRTVSSSYAANNRQDESLIDRFNGNYYFIDYDRNLEINLVFSKVFEIFDKIRDILLEEDFEDEVPTLRVMQNANVIYRLEMLRMMGEANGGLPPQPKGKTLRKSVESFVSILDEDLQKSVIQRADLASFYNSYKDMSLFKSEIKFFESSAKRIAPVKK